MEIHKYNKHFIETNLKPYEAGGIKFKVTE